MDLEQRQQNTAASMQLNLDRRHNIECVLKGVTPRARQTDDGWWVVSRHVAKGSNSAYAVQNRLRRLHPQLETRVRKNVDPDNFWSSEIQIRLRQETNNG